MLIRSLKNPLPIKLIKIHIFFLSFVYALDGDMYDLFLPNGMKVILMEKHSAPKVGLGVYYNVGSHDEKWGQKGINKLIKRIIVTQGTDKFTFDELITKRHEFALGYGDSDGRDITYYYSELPKDQLEFGLDFESDRMNNLIITNSKLNNAKQEFKIKYEEYHDNEMWVTFNNSLSPLLEKDHPYKIDEWGIWEQIDTLSIQTCQNYYNKYYTPNNAVLVIVGNIVPENVINEIFQYFGSIPSNNEILIDPNLSFDKMSFIESAEFNVINKNISMYHGVSTIEFFMPSARSDDAILIGHLKNILNFDLNSNGLINKKFTKNNRQTHHTIFDDKFCMGRSSFLIGGVTFGKNLSIKKFSKSVLSGFKHIEKYGIDNDFLDLYKKSELLKIYKENNKFYNIANRLGKSELINGDYNQYNRKMELLEELTNEDIKHIVKKYFHKDNMYTYLVSANSDAKKWYTRLILLLAENIIFRFYNPFQEF